MKKTRKEQLQERLRTWTMAALVFIGTNGWAPTIAGWWLSLDGTEQATPEEDGAAATDDEPGNGCDDERDASA